MLVFVFNFSPFNDYADYKVRAEHIPAPVAVMSFSELPAQGSLSPDFHGTAGTQAECAAAEACIIRGQPVAGACNVSVELHCGRRWANLNPARRWARD